MLTVIQNEDEASGLAPLLFSQQIRKFNGKPIPLPEKHGVHVCPERLLGPRAFLQTALVMSGIFGIPSLIVIKWWMISIL